MSVFNPIDPQTIARSLVALKLVILKFLNKNYDNENAKLHNLLDNSDMLDYTLSDFYVKSAFNCCATVLDNTGVRLLPVIISPSWEITFH